MAKKIKNYESTLSDPYNRIIVNSSENVDNSDINDEEIDSDISESENE
ncbi:34386_t:CDS:2, partial [Gigaspora margarita]